MCFVVRILSQIEKNREGGEGSFTFVPGWAMGV